MSGYVLINGEKYSVSIFGGIVRSRPEVPRQSDKSQIKPKRKAKQ